MSPYLRTIIRGVVGSRPEAVVISGIAVDDDGAPVADATVEVTLYSPSPTQVVSATTNGAGFYKIETKVELVAGGVQGYVHANSPERERYFTYISSPPTSGAIELTANVRLYRIQRIAAGESIPVTVAPGDTGCGHDDELVCRVVRVVVPGTGRLTLTCEPKGDDNGGPGLTIVGYNGRASSGQPWFVDQGEVSVEVGMWFTWPTSQSCLLTTSFQATGHN